MISIVESYYLSVDSPITCKESVQGTSLQSCVLVSPLTAQCFAVFGVKGQLL